MYGINPSQILNFIKKIIRISPFNIVLLILIFKFIDAQFLPQSIIIV